jgi:hypothetical protein
MNPRIKSIGLALVAALALVAVMASPASAQFTSSSSHTILTGSQEGSHEFTAGEGFGGITCTTASFAGTGAGESETTQVITPTYSNCKDTFGRPVVIDNGTNGGENPLTYTFTSGAGKGQVHVSGEMALTNQLPQPRGHERRSGHNQHDQRQKHHLRRLPQLWRQQR